MHNLQEICIAKDCMRLSDAMQAHNHHHAVKVPSPKTQQPHTQNVPHLLLLLLGLPPGLLLLR